MKTIVALVCFVVTASLVHAQATPTVKPVDPKAPVAKPTDPKATATVVDPKAAPGAKKEVKKEAPLPKIPGTVISRNNGTFLSLKLVSNNFVLTFYDKKHKPMAIDVTRATARWPNNKTSLPKDYRTVLNGSGTALVGQRPVLPPFNFPVSIVLLQGDGDDAKAVESYTVPFSG